MSQSLTLLLWRHQSSHIIYPNSTCSPPLQDGPSCILTPAFCIVVCTGQVLGYVLTNNPAFSLKMINQTLGHPWEEWCGWSHEDIQSVHQCVNVLKVWLGALPTALLTKAAIRKQVGAGWLAEHWWRWMWGLQLFMIIHHSAAAQGSPAWKGPVSFSRPLWLFQLGTLS